MNSDMIHTIQTLTNTLTAIRSVISEVGEVNVEEVTEEAHRDFVDMVHAYVHARNALIRLEGTIARTEVKFTKTGAESLPGSWKWRG